MRGIPCALAGSTRAARRWGRRSRSPPQGPPWHILAWRRAADTRLPPGTPLLGTRRRSFPVGGLCGIPADAQAVALNVTAVNPSDVGDLRLYPDQTVPPLASAVNFSAGRTRAGNAIVPLGINGQIEVQCDMPTPAGTTHLVLDAYGYFGR
jgi:hypothetical protein